MKKKLIEVALPLDAINEASAREKSIRHGHPSTLHLWWARRPLASARAVIFAQMVDDPESLPDEFPSKEAQDAERKRLHHIIEDLVKWENTTNEEVLEKARVEIRRSWARWCKESGEDPAKLPPFHDPFAGGGSLPLEAQRLGLEAHASDLNPVAVMINKAMIEIPPRFAGQPPVNPDSHQKMTTVKQEWRGAEGLAEDVRYYGQWMRDEAEKRIGHLYPTVKAVRNADGSYRHATSDDLSNSKTNVEDLTVIAWLWARTVESSNPAYRGCHVPLVSSFWLSKKPGKEAWVEPVVEGKTYRFVIRTGKPADPKNIDAGTKLSRGANFQCILSGTPLSGDHIKAEGKAGRMGARLMATVCEGTRGRVYLEPTEEHEGTAASAKPTWGPQGEVPSRLTGGTCYGYGLTTWDKLFTPRQLVALTTFSDLVAEARDKVRVDAQAAGIASDGRPLREGGSGALAYAEAVSVYLGFGLSKVANLGSIVTSWMNDRGAFRETFARQAIPMVWDFAEANTFSGSGGSINTVYDKISMAISSCPSSVPSFAEQIDAGSFSSDNPVVISTDPPYYDNIGYADLSDFFYVWLKRTISTAYPSLFTTLLVPKAEELVATPYRHGSKLAAEEFFLTGMTKAMHAMSVNAHRGFPVSIYYAFKQSENDSSGVASTGWETFLDAVVASGFSIKGTWPIRTEGAGRLIGLGTNALASSIVLVCRPRPASARISTRKDFLDELRRTLPLALHHLQEAAIAPVDFAQAAIGPGMAVFTQYTKVVDASGEAMTVRQALQLINQYLDEYLSEQEGEYDNDTRWAVTWFETHGMSEKPFGEAETLSTAKNTSVKGLADAGIITAKAGKVQLIAREQLPDGWLPEQDRRLTAWEATQYLIRTLDKEGEDAAARLLKRLGSLGEVCRDLSYRLYNICERKKWSQDAFAYNSLVIAWPRLTSLASQIKPEPTQTSLL